MNYIRHLHAFYQSIKKDEGLSALHITLYLALFQYWNYNRFQNPFPINRGELMQLSKIKTKNSYHRCLKELHQKNFIIYHSSNSKFIRAKVSITKLGLKMADDNFCQLELFDLPTLAPHGIKNDTDSGTDIDTGISQNNNPPVSKTIPSRYQKQYRHGIKNDTATVSKTILLIKHKHKTVNYSSICYKKTAEIIFEKNNQIQQAVSLFKKSFLLEKDGPADSEKAISIPSKNAECAAPEKANPALKDVSAFFLQQNFPDREAQRFYYYNQGRNWMLNNHIPITDWQAMAHKWMLNQEEKNILNGKPTNNGKNDTKQSANSAFLRDAKNDFYASAGRSAGDHP